VPYLQLDKRRTDQKEKSDFFKKSDFFGNYGGVWVTDFAFLSEIRLFCNSCLPQENFFLSFLRKQESARLGIRRSQENDAI
jgi:hypothetical protein